MRRDTLLLFGVLSAIYVGCAAGYLDTPDAVPSVATAKQLVEHQSLRLTTLKDPTHFLFYRTTDGAWFTKLGLTMPALYVVPVILAKGAARLTNFSEPLLTDFFVSLVNSFVSAGVVALVFVFLRRQGQSRHRALGISLTLALATTFFVYSKTAQREPFQALCLVGAFLFSAHPDLAGRVKGGLFLAGTFAGLAFLTKHVMVLPALFAILYASKSRFRFRAGRAELFFLYLPIFLACGIWATYAWQASGRPWHLGYGKQITTLDAQVWSTPLWRGLFVQLLGLDSIWFHSPVLLLPVLYSAKKLWLRHLSFFDGCAWGAILCQALIHATWIDPMGGFALGPRYLVAVVPLFALLLTGPLSLAPPVRWCVGVLITGSFLLQCVEMSVKPQQYWIIKRRSQVALSMPHWLANFTLFRHKASGKKEQYDISQFSDGNRGQVDVSDLESLQGFNFWWAHLARSKEASTR